MNNAENSFLNEQADSYAIYQLKYIPETRGLRFISFAQAVSKGKRINHDHYDLVYAGRLEKHDRDIGEILDDLYAQFNLNRPGDFHGHSMSMSDIVALKINGFVSFHYVDTFGFQQVPDFLPDNLLHSAEIGLEDDYNMIDGIVGNNGRNPAKKERKPAVSNTEQRLPFKEQLRLVMQEQVERMPARTGRKPELGR
ncbi:MAG: DUF4316 domain-containing protein [Clostridia bacterium]|nr:DUF4316 domain-containing protein [Clostridia bacterium]